MDDILRRRDAAEEVKGSGYLELKSSIKLLSDKVTVLFLSDAHVMSPCGEVAMHHCALALCDVVAALDLGWCQHSASFAGTGCYNEQEK